MVDDGITLSPTEKKWILSKRITRETDGKEVQIYPMGAERYLCSVLSGQQMARYDISSDVVGKDILVIPGHGNSGFLFAAKGAKSVTVYDKDPVTIAWIKAFKRYYYFREQRGYPSVGELLKALTAWYPPRLTLPVNRLTQVLNWVLYPNGLRRIYLHYLLSLIRKALESKQSLEDELKKEIHCYSGTLEEVSNKKTFDTAYVPYLLGVQNGIEQAKQIVDFIQLLAKKVKGHVLVSPSRNKKEFFVMGKRYLVTVPSLHKIPGLEQYFLDEDKHWFHTQGLAIFKDQAPC